MATPIVVPYVHTNTRKIECIVQDGQKYCETTDTTPREFGIMLLLIVGYCTILLGSVIWSAAGDSLFRFVLPILVFLAPIILMIIYGG